MMGLIKVATGALKWVWHLSPLVGFFGILTKFTGIGGFLSPIIGAIGAALVPVFEAIGKFIVMFFTSLGKGLAMSMRNFTSFWALFICIFLAGGWYLGSWDLFGAKGSRNEIAVLKEDVRVLEKRTGTKAPSRSRRRATPRPRRKPVNKSPFDYIRDSLGG